MYETLVVVVAVLATVYAGEITKAKLFVPKNAGCKFHDYADKYEDWGMLASPDTGYVKTRTVEEDDSGSTDFIRCDVKNDKGFCMYITSWKNGTCEYEWMDKSDYYLDPLVQYYYQKSSFIYHDEEELSECPTAIAAIRRGVTNPSKKCRRLIQYTDDSKTEVHDTMVVDEFDRIIVSANLSLMTELFEKPVVITYGDTDFPLSIFDDARDCSGAASFPKAVPVCTTTSSASTLAVSVVALLAVFAALL